MIDFMLKYLPDVRSIAVNDKDWTILNFKDGEKVIVKCSQDYDLEKGILYAYAKKHRTKSVTGNREHLNSLAKDNWRKYPTFSQWPVKSLFNPVASDWFDLQKKLQQQYRRQEIEMTKQQYYGVKNKS
jgi:hypothetical protein